MVRVMILAPAEMDQATSLTMTTAALQATTTALASGRWRCGTKYTFLTRSRIPACVLERILNRSSSWTPTGVGVLNPVRGRPGPHRTPSIPGGWGRHSQWRPLETLRAPGAIQAAPAGRPDPSPPVSGPTGADVGPRCAPAAPARRWVADSPAVS